ncbi:MAG: endonuclease/exonuclease/phosphatase family protein [Bacteroidales bacterium]
MKQAKYTLLLFFQFLFAFSLIGQEFENLSFGTDKSLEILSWNIEHFPQKGNTTVDYVAKSIQNLDADIIACQEIESNIYFKKLLNLLPDYEGYYVPGDYASLALIYKKGVIKKNKIFEIFTSSWNSFPRAPIVMDFNFKGQKYILINNHLKCCGNGILEKNNYKDEENRRYMACTSLKDYILDKYKDVPTILVGDLNDEITDSPKNNVFSPFLDNPDEFKFTDMDIARGNSKNWSYPSYPSHLDHILVNKPLFDEIAQNTTKTECIKIDDITNMGWYNYQKNISDHRPVGIKFFPKVIDGIEDLNVESTSFYNTPNPIYTETSFHMDNLNEKAEILIYNPMGQLIDHIDIAKGQKIANWTPKSEISGIYYAILKRNNKNTTRKLLILK